MNGDEGTIVGVTMLGHALVHTYELSIPVFIPIWLDQFSLTTSTVGAVVALGYGLFGFGSLPAGILADVRPPRALLTACFLGMGASFLALSVAPSVPVIAVALLLWGAAASIYHPVGLSLISRGVDRRGKALGYHGIAGNVGIAAGPLAAILLLTGVGWRATAAMLAIPGLLGGLIAWLSGLDAAVPVEPGAGESARVFDSDGAFSLSGFLSYTRASFSGLFVVVFALVIFEGLYYRGALTFLPDLLGGFSTFGPVAVGNRSLPPSRYLYVAFLVVGVVGQYLGGWLSERVTPSLGVGLVYFGLAVAAVAFIPVASAGVGPLLVASAVLAVLLFGEQPLLQATVAEHSATGSRGISYGFMYIGVFGIGAAGAAITGALLTYADETALFAFLALLGLFATATSLTVYWYGTGRERRAETPA